MVQYQVHKLSPNFVIEVTPYARGFTLSDHEKILVENIWNHELSQRPAQLHNGQILNMVSWEQDRMVAEFVEYKYCLAQMRDPNFEPVLGIRPVAVSGMTTVVDKVLIGKRSEDVTTYPKAYELVPSGGIDPRAVEEGKIDLLKQLELELWEETGISVTEIKEIRLLALVYDETEKLYDLCAEISVNYSILKETLEPREEYDLLKWIPKSDVESFIEKHQSEFVPLSLFLLQKFPL